MLTLIGSSLAEKGLIFMNYGSATECEKCRFKGACIDSLEEGRLYIIKDVKDTEHRCPVHEGGKVKVVQVERADLQVLIDAKKAFEGSNIIFKPVDCDVDCNMRQYCFPDGLFRDDRCKIIRNIGQPPYKCVKGLDLRLVMLR